MNFGIYCGITLFGLANAFRPPAAIGELLQLTGLKGVSPGQKALLHGIDFVLQNLSEDSSKS